MQTEYVFKYNCQIMPEVKLCNPDLHQRHIIHSKVKEVYLKMEPRNQFTFYRSFWTSVSKLSPDIQLPFLQAIIQYALDGIIPEDLDPVCTAMFALVRPNLDASRRRAESGRIGGSKSKANTKQHSSEKEIELDKEDESDNEGEIEVMPIPSVNIHTFDELWNAYPIQRRGNRNECERAWCKLSPIQQRAAVDNLHLWKSSSQWLDDNGTFVPYIVNYINPNKNYIISNPPLTKSYAANSKRELDSDEVDAIRKLMQDDN